MVSCFIPCEIDNLCASLEHTWLKNRLLSQIEANHRAWVLGEVEELPRILETIPRQVQRARGLITYIYDGYSPAQLVDRVPLSVLPAEIKTIIKDAVHICFLDLGLIQPLATELENALNHFELVAEKIGTEWKGGPHARARVINELKTAAIRLRKALLALPREVVLP